ncbi:hypothetical protein OFN56_36035, partial [Escherichia coli]|nr:hypothetical protein [Escherichia coli]
VQRVAPERKRVATRYQLSCDALRRHAVQDALRPLCYAERRDQHSRTTIIKLLPAATNQPAQGKPVGVTGFGNAAR